MYNSEHHSGWKYYAEGENHEADVRPQYCIDGVGGDDCAFGDGVMVAAVGGCELGEDEEYK
jgi:hypothetical protein